MKLRTKLFLSYLIIILISGASGYYLIIDQSQKALTDSITQNLTLFTLELSNKIDQEVAHRIEQAEIYSSNLAQEEELSLSNLAFSEMEDIETYISTVDGQWIESADSIKTFQDQLLQNTLSETIRSTFQQKDYYETKYGANVFSDYYQADELWWQEAKEQGKYYEDVQYDESAQVYSLAISHKIIDEEGNFLGVTKILVDISDILAIVDDYSLLNSEGSNLDFLQIYAEQEEDYFLLDKEGKIISSNQHFVFSEVFPEEIYARFWSGHDGTEDLSPISNFFGEEQPNNIVINPETISLVNQEKDGQKKDGNTK